MRQLTNNHLISITTHGMRLGQPTAHKFQSLRSMTILSNNFLKDPTSSTCIQCRIKATSSLSAAFVRASCHGWYVPVPELNPRSKMFLAIISWDNHSFMPRGRTSSRRHLTTAGHTLSCKLDTAAASLEPIWKALAILVWLSHSLQRC